MFDINNYEFENLVDEGRQLVITEIGRQLAAYPKKICLCNDCILDIAAMALNSLQPRYRCSLLGSIYQSDGLSDPEYSASLKHAVKVAIERVGSNPGHD
ncbi:MAG: late competence development ComFB family protein [Spirochaetaceae bacterium]|jgi:competence protein ComFB|nr:late competence development ComFB family protein [Spirochaetaceae bacterium]